MKKNNRLKKRPELKAKQEAAREKPSVSPAPISDEPEFQNRKFFTRNRIAAAVAILGITVAGFRAATANQTDSHDETAEQETETAKKPFKPFSFKDYRAPKEGKVIGSQLAPNAKKTIILIADRHVTFDEKDPSEGLQVQKEIFAIVEDAMMQYGNIPLVIENWTDYGGRTYEKNIAIDSLLQLAGKKKADRIADGKKMIGRERVGAGSLLAATYGEGITPLPSQSEKDQIEILTKRALFERMTMMATSPTGFCSNIISQGSPMTTIAEAETNFRFTRRSQSDVDCFCAFHAMGNKFYKDFIDARSITAANEEIRRTAQYPGPLVFVIAGAMHAKQAIKKAGENNANIIVVSPVSTALITLGELLKGDREPLVLDDENKTCESWAKANQEQLHRVEANLDQATRLRMTRVMRDVDIDIERKIRGLTSPRD